ncbi:hypothetical protein DFH01_00890 [Falsiroseomonas bella]|uniref:Uncharacterized protein n=1 Tax=Falsiroseomonas bella TaxID=2184016 RepID=A0A317FGI7_9PROT|nr:hypothetical protein [Falsiroseomonas bella]PWS37905.1 hypothetical protein DFH01_00890 [Falsiroseomonas bella]
MSDRAEETGELRRLSAALVELRAELTVTQAALAAAMAEIARLGPEPKPGLADAVSRLLGFADAAAAGLQGQKLVRAQAPTDAALRMADWAEGLLAGSDRR